VPKPVSRPAMACSRPPAANRPGCSAPRAGTGRTTERASIVLIFAGNGPCLGRVDTGRIDHFARAVERVTGAQHGLRLLVAQRPVGPCLAARPRTALAGHGQCRAPLLTFACARRRAYLLVDSGFGQRLADAARTVSATRQAAAFRSRVGGIVDIS